jgi:methionyl-tRNA synthetase
MKIKDEITYDDFTKLDMRIGLIKAAEMVPDTDKLIKCTIDFGGDVGERTIVSGIREWYAPEELVGKRLPYLINLAPRELRGVVSEGMLLAAAPLGDDGQRGLALMELDETTPAGTTIG